MDYNQRERAQQLLECIHSMATQPICIMEVCGTHTMAIAKSGLKELLPSTVRIVSGPGCPVCVTAEEDIDAMIVLAQQSDVTVATYGDMVRVPGSESSLQEAKAKGADVRIVYSALDALTQAKHNPAREFILLAIGFETTAPTIAIALEHAILEGVRNFSIFVAHKSVPPVLKALLTDSDVCIDAFILPGHVCAITGTNPFSFIAERYHRPCVVAGFETLDILEAILMLLRQFRLRRSQVENQYQRAVRPMGNAIAQNYLDKYFKLVDTQWRGIGWLPASGYQLKKEYFAWDACNRLGITVRKNSIRERKPCICGEILKGQKLPADCPLFGQNCKPTHPLGPCMVSSEGACAAAYYFNGFLVPARRNDRE